MTIKDDGPVKYYDLLVRASVTKNLFDGGYTHVDDAIKDIVEDFNIPSNAYWTIEQRPGEVAIRFKWKVSDD